MPPLLQPAHDRIYDPNLYLYYPLLRFLSFLYSWRRLSNFYCFASVPLFILAGSTYLALYLHLDHFTTLCSPDSSSIVGLIPVCFCFISLAHSQPLLFHSRCYDCLSRHRSTCFFLVVRRTMSVPLLFISVPRSWQVHLPPGTFGDNIFS